MQDDCEASYDDISNVAFVQGGEKRLEDRTRFGHRVDGTPEMRHSGVHHAVASPVETVAARARRKLRSASVASKSTASE